MTAETLETTPKGQQRKSYLPNYAVNVAQSVWVSESPNFRLSSPFRQRALSSPTHIGKQGNIKQLGGEFIFGPGMFKIYDTCLVANNWQVILARSHLECNIQRIVRFIINHG